MPDIQTNRDAGAGHVREIAIAAGTALAVLVGAAGGILLTRQNATTPPAPTISPVAATTTTVAPTTVAAPIATVVPPTPSPSPTSGVPSPTSTSQSFADLYRIVSSGVVLIQATTCDGGGIGTGFLIAPDLVATVAHVADGIAYAVAPSIAHPLLQSWVNSSASAVTAPCTNPAGPEQEGGLVPTLPDSPDPVTEAVGQVFKTYFDGINSANYEQAWLMLSPRLRGSSWASFAEGTSTSYDTEVVLLSVTPGADQSVTAHVTFTSVQASEKGPGGDTCNNWSMDYTLIPSDDTWLIDKALGHNGGPKQTSC